MSATRDDSLRSRLAGLVGGQQLAWVSIVIAVLALGYDYLAGHTACAWDTSDCALSHLKDGFYAGVVTDPVTHRVVANRRLPIYFDSTRSYVTTISTDSTGAYCIAWAREHALPAARLRPDFDVSLSNDWQPLRGGLLPAGCQTTSATVPWNRAEDLTSRWQYRAPLWLAVGAILMLGLSLLDAVGTRAGFRLAGAMLTTSALVVCVLVWT